MKRNLSIVLVGALVLAFGASVPCSATSTLFSQLASPEAIPAGGPYVPPGSLYDNEQSDATTSLASQDSTGTLTARTADDFTLVNAACTSGVFEISQIRLQMVQADTAPQPFAVDLYADGGAGTVPVAGITPFATFAQTSSVNLGAFGAGTSIWEAAFATPGLVLNDNTIYWISGFGATAASNGASFNNFFAASAGAAATTDNGVIIAPGAGVAAWTPVEQVIGGNPLAFSFAIDGACQVPAFSPDIPTLSPLGIGLLGALLALAATALLARRRRSVA